MDKAHILNEISRTATANDGVALGKARFESETGIKPSDWYGIHWATWGDAVREAGFTPNELNSAFDSEFLLRRYSELVGELGRLPTDGDLRLKRRRDSSFPNSKTFARFGNKKQLATKLIDFCGSHEGYEVVIDQCKNYLRSLASSHRDDETPTEEMAIGYVYLLKHGSRREYKIGRTYNRLRREGEIGIELPEKVEPVHVIETDDPSGVEAYWHRRFASKRKEGEWFALTAQDVRAFKRWKRIY